MIDMTNAGIRKTKPMAQTYIFCMPAKGLPL
jgi:hypothetical protein